MVMAVKISAIICTFNRAGYLPKSIQSLVNQTLKTDSYEIIVIDNCSTDDTKKIVTEDFADIANLLYIYEPIQGLSQARNTGWQKARGEYIAYLDDDAIACDRWLEKIIEAFETVTPKPGVVGGKIEPIWEVPRPSWLSDNLVLGLTVLNWSDTPLFLDKHQWVAGANIAYPRYLLEEMKGFETSLGRKGTKLLSCEENLLHARLKAEGYKIYYDPAIAVRHHIPASRLVPDWHIKRQYWNGVSLSVLSRYQLKPPMRERIQEAWLLKNDVFKLTKQIVKLKRKKAEKKLLALKCSLAYKLGYIYGLLKI